MEVSNWRGNGAPESQVRFKAPEPSLDAARSILVSDLSNCPSLPPSASASLRSIAAQAFLSDFSDSVHAAALAVAAGSSKDSGPGSSPANGAPDQTPSENFPSLAEASSRATSAPKRKSRARKKLNPSRVSPSDATAPSLSFATAVAANSASAVPLGRGRSDPSDKATSGSSSQSRRIQALNQRSSVISSKSDGIGLAGGITSEPGSLSQAVSTDPKSIGQSKLAQLTMVDDLGPYISRDCVKRAAMLHAHFIVDSISPAHTVCASLHTLADALRIPPAGPFTDDASAGAPQGGPLEGSSETESSFASGLFSMLPDGGYDAPVYFCAHAILVLDAVVPLIAGLPKPLLDVISRNAMLAMYAPALKVRLDAAEDVAFPVPRETTDVLFSRERAQTASANLAMESDDGSEKGPKRLLVNLEGMWDKVIDLQRIHRGDISRFPAGTLDREAVCKALSGLHPANMDAFAARFIALVTRSACQSDQRANENRIRRLSARMTKTKPLPGNASSTAAPGPTPPSGEAASGAGVVLHRLPDIVREILRGDGAELFFLEFIDAADSAKLNDAIGPRLSASLHTALTAAATASSNESFTEAALKARLYAKLLSATMHIGNWAHSSFSFSGADGLGAAAINDGNRANSLPVHVMKMRATVCSAKWKCCMDVSALIQEARASQNAPAVLAVTAVADVALRVAAVDPVSSLTAWFTSAIASLQDLQLAVSNADRHDTAFLSHVKVISLVIEELFFELQVPRTHPKVPEILKEGRLLHVSAGKDRALRCTIGDVRFVSGCIPVIDDLRRRFGDPSPLRVSGAVQKRRIRPLPAAVDSAERGREIESQPLEDVDADKRDQGDAKGPVGVSSGLDTRSGVQSAIWEEFYSRLDKRLRNVADLVISSASEGDEAGEIRARFEQVAALLFHEVPKSVVGATAEYCGRVAKPKGRRDSREKKDVPKDVEKNGSNTPKDCAPERTGPVGEEGQPRSSLIDEFSALMWGPSESERGTSDVYALLSRAGIRVPSACSLECTPSTTPGCLTAQKQ